MLSAICVLGAPTLHSGCWPNREVWKIPEDSVQPETYRGSVGTACVRTLRRGLGVSEEHDWCGEISSAESKGT